MQPEYCEKEHKLEARAENAAIFRRVMGVDSIPKDREYWTLCNKQSLDEGSEIMQMERLGILNKCQFHGVDRDFEIIQQNKIWHPEAHWHNKEWLDAINDEFNPSMIYLDMTSFAGFSVAIELIARTMFKCPPNTLLLANTMLNDPRSRRTFDAAKSIKGIEKKVPPSELKKWNLKVENYTYSATGRTTLLTQILHKKG